MTIKGKTPHQRIVVAGRKGRGVRLSAEEVQYLMFDDSIKTRAESDDLGTSEDRDQHEVLARNFPFDEVHEK